jgi:spore germination cell wall hydrolase CwlJ-like protein
MTATVNPVQINWTKATRNALALLGFVLVMYILAHVTHLKLDSLRNINFDGTVITAAEREKQLDCLAQNIYYEAGHEPFEGKVAVAQVTMNRVESGKFGKGVCGVIYQKNAIYEKVICQFSWVCETKSRIKPINTAAYTESEEVAKKVLLEEFRLPGLTEALFYHADYIDPKWGKPKITKIGHHIFYK